MVCIARRTRIPADHIPTERARKPRTIPKDQLALALQGRLEHVFGYVHLTYAGALDPFVRVRTFDSWSAVRDEIEAMAEDW